MERSGRRAAGGRIPRRLWLRLALLAALLLTGLLATRFGPLSELLTREVLAARLEALRQSGSAPAVLLALYALVTPLGFPVSPLVFAGGAVFGSQLGWLYNFLGCVLGATLSYLLARRLGRELVVHLLGERRLERAEALVSEHGFWAVFRLRFVPIPFVAVHTAAALAGVPFPTYFLASVLGIAPVAWIYTYFSHALVSATAADRPGVVRDLALSVLLLVAITLSPYLRRVWKLRRGRDRD